MHSTSGSLAAGLVDDPEVAVLVGHARLAAEFLLDRERLLVYLLGPVELAARLVDDPEVDVGGGRVACLSLGSTDGQPASMSSVAFRSPVR